MKENIIELDNMKAEIIRDFQVWQEFDAVWNDEVYGMNFLSSEGLNVETSKLEAYATIVADPEKTAVMFDGDTDAKWSLIWTSLGIEVQTLKREMEIYLESREYPSESRVHLFFTDILGRDFAGDELSDEDRSFIIDVLRPSFMAFLKKNEAFRAQLLSQIKEDKFSGIPCVEAVAGFGEALVKVLSQEEVEVDVSQYRGKVKDFLSEANTKFHSSFNESGYC